MGPEQGVLLCVRRGPEDGVAGIHFIEAVAEMRRANLPLSAGNGTVVVRPVASHVMTGQFPFTF
jgi:hypothetical protein